MRNAVVKRKKALRFLMEMLFETCALSTHEHQESIKCWWEKALIANTTYKEKWCFRFFHFFHCVFSYVCNFYEIYAV